jgi:RNA polymerase sigma-70 factor (ECF subfamily)
MLERARRGERRALDELVEAHRLPLWRFAMRLTGNGAEADDLAQDTLVRALRALEGFRGEAALRTWLLRIASNLWIERVGKAERRRRDDREVEEVAPPDPPRLVEGLLARERQDELRRAVAGLPPRQRATLVLKVYHEMTFEQVAATLGCPVGTAKANYHHALSRLRRELGAIGASGGAT